MRLHIVPALGSIRLAELSLRRVQGFLDALGATAAAEKAHALLRVVLKDAGRLGYVRLDAAARTRLPYRQQAGRQSFTLAELDALLAAAGAYRSGPLVRLAAYTRLRRGEGWGSLLAEQMPVLASLVWAPGVRGGAVRPVARSTRGDPGPGSHEPLPFRRSADLYWHRSDTAFGATPLRRAGGCRAHASAT